MDCSVQREVSAPQKGGSLSTICSLKKMKFGCPGAVKTKYAPWLLQCGALVEQLSRNGRNVICEQHAITETNPCEKHLFSLLREPEETRGNTKLPPSVLNFTPNLPLSFFFEPVKQLFSGKTGIHTGRSAEGYMWISRWKSAVQDGAHVSHASRSHRWQEHPFVFWTRWMIVDKITPTSVFFFFFFLEIVCVSLS